MSYSIFSDYSAAPEYLRKQLDEAKAAYLASNKAETEEVVSDAVPPDLTENTPEPKKAKKGKKTKEVVEGEIDFKDHDNDTPIVNELPLESAQEFSGN